MTAEPRQSPRMKQQIKDRLFEYLYTPVKRKHDQRIKELILANSKALASSQDGFMYRNNWYSLDIDKTPPRLKNRLIKTLQPQMEEHLAEANQLSDYEIPYVLGFITRVLNASGCMTDYLKVFPTPIHPPLKELATTCPSDISVIDDAMAEELQANNAVAVDLIKSRLVLNLLLQ